MLYEWYRKKEIKYLKTWLPEKYHPQLEMYLSLRKVISPVGKMEKLCAFFDDLESRMGKGNSDDEDVEQDRSLSSGSASVAASSVPSV